MFLDSNNGTNKNGVDEIITEEKKSRQWGAIFIFLNSRTLRGYALHCMPAPLITASVTLIAYLVHTESPGNSQGILESLSGQVLGCGTIQAAIIKFMDPSIKNTRFLLTRTLFAFDSLLLRTIQCQYNFNSFHHFVPLRTYVHLDEPKQFVPM